MRYTVNIEDIEESLNSLGGEAKAKAIQSEVLKKYCVGEIPENYKNERSFRQTIQRKIEDYCPQAEGFDTNDKPIKFIRVGHGIYRLSDNSALINILLPEEVESPEEYQEGATQTISVNHYERNPEARQACINHYGYSCIVCGFDFEKAYGEIGKDFIHVHHLRPLAEIGESYVVNPVQDLRPICPNCHSMIHRRKTLLSIEELKQQLTNESS
jgi:predicted HNH restriction endonuclease